MVQVSMNLKGTTGKKEEEKEEEIHDIIACTAK